MQPAVAACYGGRGGPGGNGGHGAGGAGGISIGILHSGTAPEVDAATTILPGTAGALGLGAAGALGPGGVNNSGLAGLSEKILNANAL